MLQGGAAAIISQAFENLALHPFALVFGGLFLAVLGYIVYQRFLSPLAKFPGPFWASLTPFWKLHAFSQGNFHEQILTLHEKYGKFVRIAPTEVIISDGSAIRDIYSTTNGRDYLKVGFAFLRKAHLYLTTRSDRLLRV